PHSVQNIESSGINAPHELQSISHPLNVCQSSSPKALLLLLSITYKLSLNRFGLEFIFILFN
ncbi:MAG: hypothetical protein VXX39_06140, partial [Candidatus Thermoplasmatota archaeon]|nr:hypothetical protein [Candidatus Thermoplasmatota archaeon]